MSVHEQAVPEFWDAGFWYVVPCDLTSRPGYRIPAQAPARWTATYGIVDGVDYALLRSPELWLNAPEVAVSVDEVIAAAKVDGYANLNLIGKPGGRVNGQ